jgi:hypothetical protein
MMITQIKTIACCVFILITGLLPAAAGAVEFGVGVGLSDGSRDNPALQQDYARLKQDIRSLETLEKQLDRLGRKDAPAKLADAARGEWERQSKWLLEQSREVADLAAEMEDYLQQFTGGSAASGFFDYQATKFKMRNRLDTIENAAKKYALEDKQAVERQSDAVKLISRSY